jgi:protein-tyrosine phosphatase
MFNKILVVCLGNICRSPMAEGILKHWLATKNSPITVSSAGLSAVVNCAPPEFSVGLLKARNIDISMHRARQLTENLVRESDLILVMENGQKKKIESLYPFALGKVFLLGKWDNFEVPDPYTGFESDYENALNLIDKGLNSWQKKICP